MTPFGSPGSDHRTWKEWLSMLSVCGGTMSAGSAASVRVVVAGPVVHPPAVHASTYTTYTLYGCSGVESPTSTEDDVPASTYKCAQNATIKEHHCCISRYL
jgi:hypothetical protein